MARRRTALERRAVARAARYAWPQPWSGGVIYRRGTSRGNVTGFAREMSKITSRATLKRRGKDKRKILPALLRHAHLLRLHVMHAGAAHLAVAHVRVGHGHFLVSSRLTGAHHRGGFGQIVTRACHHSR